MMLLLILIRKKRRCKINKINWKKADDDFNFDFDNFGEKKKDSNISDSKKENSPKEENFGDPFGEEKPAENQETGQGKLVYPLETIEEDPREVDSRKASKISYRGKPEANSEYNLKSTKNATSQDRNFEINDFESYNETVDNRSMVDSTAYYKENPTAEIFNERK